MLHYVVTVFIYIFVMFYLQLLLFVFTYWFFKKMSVVVFIASLTTIYCSKHNHLFVHVSRNCV